MLGRRDSVFISIVVNKTLIALVPFVLANALIFSFSSFLSVRILKKMAFFL